MTRRSNTDDETRKVSPGEAGAPPLAPSEKTCLMVAHPTLTTVVRMPRDGVKVLGRGQDADILVDDETISRNHVKFFKKGADLFVQDLGSTNGTFVNGDKIRAAVRLAHGDEVRAGNALVQVIEVEPLKGAAPKPRGPSLPDIPYEKGGIVVRDPCMLKIYETCDRIARSFSSVIVMGETGAGKEVIARYLHAGSPCCQGPFVAINCSAIPENMAESELFGYEKGAFTGAAERKIGFIETAHQGTLFLDEVADLPAPIQPKLLRFLDQKRLIRLGGTQEIEVDVRLVCATNKELDKEVRRGAMRQDLYFRLNQFSVYVPPLRSRPLEIAALAEHFVGRMARKVGKTPPEIEEGALGRLMSYPWPGNVRELRNIVERAYVFSDGEKITREGVEALLKESESGEATKPDENVTDKVSDFEMKTISDALKACAGNQTKAARMLGISRRALIYRMSKYKM